MKRFLFVLRKPIHSGSYLQETLDILLTTAAFDQSVDILLLDDGVFHIKAHQNPDLVGLKDTSAIFKALDMYDVNNISAEIESLNERGLKPSDLFLPVNTLYRKDIAQMMKGYDVVYSG